MVRDRILNDTRQRQWASDGYLLLQGVLPQTTVARLIRQVDRLHRTEIRGTPDAKVRPGMDRRYILPDGQEFIDLIDHPAIFGPGGRSDGLLHSAQHGGSDRASAQSR